MDIFALIENALLTGITLFSDAVTKYGGADTIHEIRKYRINMHTVPVLLTDVVLRLDEGWNIEVRNQMVLCGPVDPIASVTAQTARFCAGLSSEQLSQFVDVMWPIEPLSGITCLAILNPLAA